MTQPLRAHEILLYGWQLKCLDTLRRLLIMTAAAAAGTAAEKAAVSHGHGFLK